MKKPLCISLIFAAIATLPGYAGAVDYSGLTPRKAAPEAPLPKPAAPKYTGADAYRNLTPEGQIENCSPLAHMSGACKYPGEEVKDWTIHKPKKSETSQSKSAGAVDYSRLTPK